jgi:hypothetical protein
LKFLWAGRIFFIASLLNPASFDWAKNFLSSAASEVILSDSRGDSSISFSIPTKWPTKRKLDCTISKIEEEGAEVSSEELASDVSNGLHGHMAFPSPSRDLASLPEQGSGLTAPDYKIADEKQNASTFALHARRVVFKAPMVGAEVRRSARLKGKVGGFKMDASNPTRDCICCCVDLPPPSPPPPKRYLAK